MKIWFGLDKPAGYPSGTAVTIGNFDGVHCGHRHILQRLKSEADSRSLPALAVVFEPQPPEFFAAKSGRPLPYRLSPLRDKLDLLRQTACLDGVWVLRFNQSFADMQAQEFIDRLLRERLDTRYLLIGDDFRFGAGRVGDFSLLQQQTGMVTESTPSVMVASGRASSTAVRQALKAGDIRQVEQILGHYYTLSGHVKHGKKLGRTIACPTANVHLPAHSYALSGVFVVEVSGRFGRKRGVANFGYNPTVGELPSPQLEVHIFDFDQEIYGERIQVHFRHKIRDEAKFGSMDEMMRHISADMDAARNWFDTHSEK